MSDVGDFVTPTSLRTLSVPGTPGGGPAAPLKKQIRAARAPPSPATLHAAKGVSNVSGVRDLSSTFDAVASNPKVSLSKASSFVSSEDSVDCLSEDHSNSLSLPVPQAPVTPDALPKDSVSVRANALRDLDDQPDAVPSDAPIREAPKPTVGLPVAADKAQVCPPSPQQVKSGKDSVPSKESLLGMHQGSTFPHDESERLRTVALLGILDQPDDPVLTSITKLVTRLLKVSTVGEYFSHLPQQQQDILWCHRPSLCSSASGLLPNLPNGL